MNSYDHIVVGAGSAGVIVSTRLAKQRQSVLLLEAGPDCLPDAVKYAYGKGTDPRDREAFDWRFDSKPVNGLNRRETIPRGKIVGGSSAINACIYLWGLKQDFDEWENLTSEFWSYESVCSAFREIEKDPRHGTEGKVEVCRVPRTKLRPEQAAFTRACGFDWVDDLNASGARGVGCLPLNVADRVRQSTKVCFLDPKERSAMTKLEIRADAEVRNVIIKDGKAVGVQLKGGAQVNQNKEVILCAGAIGTPHILMRSGVGPEAMLENAGVEPKVDIPGVGATLRDHPSVILRWGINCHKRADDAPRHQVGLRFTSSIADTKLDDMMVVLTTWDDYGTLDVRPTLNLARAHGSITLGPEDNLILDYRFLDHEDDLARMREAFWLCEGIFDRPPMRSYLGDRLYERPESDAKCDDFLRRSVQTGQHSCCTCPMGSVVDKLGSVHGVDCLRIVDASIMPTCIRANTNATVMMMAAKIADTIS